MAKEHKKKENKWTFFWLTGDRQVLTGDKPNEALMLAGYGGGAVRALDFYAKGDNNEYEWNETERKWRMKELTSSKTPSTQTR